MCEKLRTTSHVPDGMIPASRPVRVSSLLPDSEAFSVPNGGVASRVSAASITSSNFSGLCGEFEFQELGKVAFDPDVRGEVRVLKAAMVEQPLWHEQAVHDWNRKMPYGQPAVVSGSRMSKRPTDRLGALR
jgi:hypothetical protein